MIERFFCCLSTIYRYLESRKSRVVYRKLVVFVIVVLLLAYAQPSAAQDAVSRYESAPCKFTVPADRVVECGYLTVPENRNKADSPDIRLHVAVFKAKSSAPKPDPIIYLEGGPGGHALERLALRYQAFAAFMNDRDFIIFDQRGVGFSEPALDCPEITKLMYTMAGQRSGSVVSALGMGTTLKACRDRLLDQAVDLAAYNTTESAADVETLRVALGYASWNLYGISYGTRLALVTLGKYPDNIRSVILDSTFPPGATIFGSAALANSRRAFDTLFNGCSQDSWCNLSYPRLRATYNNLISRLNREPAKETVIHPVTRKPIELAIDGSTFSSALFMALYSKALIPNLPRVIAETNNGNYKPLAALVLRRLLTEESISQGMYYSVMCGDRELPTAVCNYWTAQATNQAKLQPVRSDVPTLVLAGEYDPVTPPAYGKQAARTLSNSYFYEFPSYGHGVSVSGPCGLSVTLSFLSDPDHEPDTRCIDQLTEPRFVVPYI